MTLTRNSKRVWVSALVCAVLCVCSTFTMAQERKTDPPKQDQTETTTPPKNRTSTLEFQKPEKIIIKEQKAGDPDRSVISGQVPNPEPNAAASGYLKIGDIKGESTPESKTRIPAHTPEWTNRTTSDPGRTEHEDNWKENKAAQATPIRGLKAADTTPRYKCGQEGGECHCASVLDCKNLWSSGECKPNTEWEDGNDDSKGGCIEKSSSATRPRTDGFVKLGDIKGEAADSKHKEWIIIESMSSPLKQESTGDIKAADTTPRYECPQGDNECYCKGVLDCKKLWASGVCRPNTEWEDGNDPSKGGCIED